MDLPSIRSGEASFDRYDEFVPEHLPEPGAFLEDQAVLRGREHAAVHRRARTLFEERGVYDVTFGYNLARLNLDQRHPTAGFRYAREDGEDEILRAEFTPTTEFCPQSDTLAVGAFRAWNLASEEFDLVRVRVDEMHHRDTAINGQLQQLETAFRETGEVPRVATGTHAEVPSEAGMDGRGRGGDGVGPR